jgi:hypothetical protein
MSLTLLDIRLPAHKNELISGERMKVFLKPRSYSYTVIKFGHRILFF